jgi:hypothetical protein
MNLKVLISILIIVVLSACGSSKKVSKHDEQMLYAPQWVKKRPINSMYYIGIAKINKSNYSDNYIEAAKRIALNDLASEISVQIQSNSIVSTFENNASYQSEFSRYIKMEMTKDLSGYQQQGSFETDDMYMVYYRLSKSKWAEIQAAKKKAAADRAITSFQQAQKDKAELNYISAINLSINALLELKKYWNESVFYTIDSQQKRLDIDIREFITSTLTSIKVLYNPSLIELNTNNKFTGKLNISVVNEKDQKLKGFPIKVNYRKTSMPYQSTFYSKNIDNIIKINSVKYKQNDLYVLIQLEKEKVLRIKNEDKKLLKFISDAFQTNPIRIPIHFALPRIFISSNKSKSPYYHYIKDAVQQSLGKHDFTIENSKKKAQLFFRINIHESKVKSTTKIMGSYLSYSIEVKDFDDKTIYTYSSDKYKGIDYSMEGAKEKSYIKASEDIDGSSFKSLMQAIIK